MTLIKCDVCGEPVDPKDNFHIGHRFGYGHHLDGSYISLDMHEACFYNKFKKEIDNQVESSSCKEEVARWVPDAKLQEGIANGFS